MSFRLVPNSVTLDDLKRRNSRSQSVLSPNSVAFGAYCVKVVEDTPILSAAEMYGPTKSLPEPSGTVRSRPDAARSRPDAARSRPDTVLTPPGAVRSRPEPSGHCP